MNYILYQLTRTIGIFSRTFRAYLTRCVATIGTTIRQLTNVSRHASKAASAALQGAMSAAQKPTSASDYVETGRLYISKALIIRVLLVLVGLGLIIYFLAWPFILSHFMTARFFEEDKRVKDWSGRVIVYSDKKKTMPLYSGRLEDGVLQGECKQYDREGVLLFEGQLKEGMRVGSGKEYVDGVLVYDGQFADGVYSGRGKRYEDGQLSYDGQYDAGLRSGSGIAYENGTILYEGQFLNDLYEGRGKLYQNGALYYDGGFHAGAAEGAGTLYSGGRVLYEGQFLNDLYEGRGKLYQNGVLRFDGSFHEGLAEGTGTAYFQNGRISYQGQYLAGKPDGVGVAYREDGRKAYDGVFSEGAYNGEGTLFFDDDSQLAATFEKGEPTGTVEWKKNGLLYYQGEWSEDCPSGFGTLYSKAGKKLYEGPFLGGTIDGRALLEDSPDALRAVFCDSSIRNETIGDGYRLVAEELGVTVLCTFQTEEADSTVYQIYLAAPEKGEWYALLPGMAHTQAVQWPENAEPKPVTIKYAAQYGVSVRAGVYFAENAVADARRTTVLYEDETRTQAVLLTWARTDVKPVALDFGDESESAGTVAAFLDALDQMESTAGSDLGEGAELGGKDPDELLAKMPGAAEAVSLADTMLSVWEQLEQISALKEAYGRVGVLLEDAREAAARGLGSEERVAALEQEQLELNGRIEVCLTRLKRVELQAGSLGTEKLEDYDLSALLLDFDPTEQDVGELSLIAAAYAQAVGREMDAETAQSMVKESLLDLTDAYVAVKLALARYQALVSNTKNAAGTYAMGLSSKEDWYGAMNEQTLYRCELCAALAEFARLANRFNELTGGWVSRSFEWHRAVFEPLFLGDILPEPEPEEESGEEPGEDEAEEGGEDEGGENGKNALDLPRDVDAANAAAISDGLTDDDEDDDDDDDDESKEGE